MRRPAPPSAAPAAALVAFLEVDGLHHRAPPMGSAEECDREYDDGGRRKGIHAWCDNVVL